MRQIVLDTETTGLSPAQGHRIIEIGCLEMLNRRLTGRSFHYYLQPDRLVDAGAMNVHGITDEFLRGKPRFCDIVKEFKEFIHGAELIIHNAPFDMGFLASEFGRLRDPWEELDEHFSVIDTLVLARKKHPGVRNNLDALCKRYGVDTQHRDKHGALLDADILAKVYLLMTGGQETLALEESVMVMEKREKEESQPISIIDVPLVLANEAEQAAHQAFLERFLPHLKEV